MSNKQQFDHLVDAVVFCIGHGQHPQLTVFTGEGKPSKAVAEEASIMAKRDREQPFILPTPLGQALIVSCVCPDKRSF